MIRAAPGSSCPHSIQDQRDHHRGKTFQEEYLAFLHFCDARRLGNTGGFSPHPFGGLYPLCAPGGQSYCFHKSKNRPNRKLGMIRALSGLNHQLTKAAMNSKPLDAAAELRTGCGPMADHPR
jgi:hypothetical protein